MKPVTISISMLRKAGACKAELSRLEGLFGPRVALTEEFALANAASCDWDWAAFNLLSGSAQAEYERVRGAAWAEYERVRDAARAEYQRVTDPARAEYERVRGAAWAEYERVRGAARAEYERAKAVTFARLYIASKNKETTAQ